jgi:thiamine-monophosphate kinase
MLDEYDIIKIITRDHGKLPDGYAPIGDDVALIPPGRRGERVVLKCDMLVARTDVPPGMGWRRASRKAVAMCVSDFAAKGVRPTAFMVSLGLPRGTKESEVDDLAAGFADASREWELRLVGGDTNEADDVVVDCVMVGFGREIVRRDSARANEYVVVSGSFGQTAAGLRILLEGAKAGPKFRREAISSVYLPHPKLELGLAISRYLSSSIDSSDGLAISLLAISEMSGVGIRLTELPFARGLKEFASRNSYSGEDLALYGGEEYEIVGTIPKEKLREARKKASSLGYDLRVVGETTAAKTLRGVVLPGGKKVEKKGWIHFRGRER